MKILIADDHRLVIEAVKAKLSELEPGIEFVLVMSVDELLAGATDDLDLALIDLNMPGADGQAHIDEIRRRHPAVPVIVLSGYEDPAIMRAALERGVLGFIPKAYSPEVMLSAVRLGMSSPRCDASFRNKPASCGASADRNTPVVWISSRRGRSKK